MEDTAEEGGAMAQCFEELGSHQHKWPQNGGHLFGPWLQKSGNPKPTRYRVCVHPECNATETAPYASA